MSFETDILEVTEEIVVEKLIKKNQKYGNSVYDPSTIFNDIGDPEVLISVRLDDKMRRLKQLDKTSEKYDSELKEIVGYLLLLINWRKHNGPCTGNNRHQGIKVESSKDTRKGTKRDIQAIIRRRLSSI